MSDFSKNPRPTGNSLGPPVRQFLARYIRNVEQLEILCTLYANPQKSWSAEEVYRVIQSSPGSVSGTLGTFKEAGFLVVDSQGRYQFAPNSPELERLVQDVAKAYRERRVSVIEMIYHRPDTLQDFAEAFRLRKNPEPRHDAGSECSDPPPTS